MDNAQNSYSSVDNTGKIKKSYISLGANIAFLTIYYVLDLPSYPRIFHTSLEEESSDFMQTSLSMFDNIGKSNF